MVSLITMKVNTDSLSSRRRANKGGKHPLASTPNKRASKVLEAAGEVFLSRGYAGASLEMIVAKSGGSYRDLYQRFGGKESLFIRVMADLCEEVLLPLRDLALNEGSKPLPVEEVLMAMGRSMLRVLLSPRALSFHRLVVSESPRFPALGKLFFQMGPSSVNETVAAFLETRAREEGLVLPDPRAAGAIFIHSVVNELHLQALTGGKVTSSEMEDRVREAVRVFLNGVRRPRD
jgi:AcrR family transcriptional regulator